MSEKKKKKKKKKKEKKKEKKIKKKKKEKKRKKKDYPMAFPGKKDNSLSPKTSKVVDFSNST